MSQSKSRSNMLITKSQLCTMLSASEASIERWLRSDPAFPQPRRLGPGSIRWLLQEVLAFIDGMPKVVYEDHAFDHNESERAELAV